MKVLVLGGTVFVGRAVVESALARGDEVVLFNRGQQNPNLFDGVPKLRGDRRGDVSQLEGTSWDVVIDTCAFEPDDVHRVVGAIGRTVERYVVVSSASVYRDWPREIVDEGSTVWKPGDGDNDYGIGKAQCEELFEAAMPGRVINARPAVIVGPHENIGRLPYWLGRAATHDEFVAPGSPDRPIQLLDARDLAAWMLGAAERGASGTFNIAGRPGEYTWGDMLDACLVATGSNAWARWVQDDVLADAGVEPWMELPLWLPDDAENAHGFDLPIDRAVEAGLTNRPLAETVEDTWKWIASTFSGPQEPVSAGSSATLDRAKEDSILSTVRGSG